MRTKRAKKSLLSWCRLVDRTFKAPPHIVALASALEECERGDCPRLIISMPPRCGKSLTSTIRFPSWWLGRNPDSRVITASHTAGLAYTFSRRSRNELAEFGESVFDVRIAEDSAAVDKWNLLGSKGGLVAAGVTGPLTGHGADLLLIDDPVKDSEAANSQVQREAILEWWRTVARTRLHPDGAIVLVMTRWHEDDLAGTLQREMRDGGEQWRLLKLPMVNEDGSTLWPERFSPEWVQQTRTAIGERAFQALYQQEPAPAVGTIFRKEWWNYWETLPTAMRHFWFSWDMSFTGSARSSYVVGQFWGKHENNRYLIDQVRGRWDFTRTLAEVRALKDKWPRGERVLIEAKANGPAVISTLRREIDGIIPVDPKGGKEARASSVAPIVEGGNVFLPAKAPWLRDLLHELTAFPFAENDDQVDALTQALNKGPQEVTVPGFDRVRPKEAVVM